MDLLIRYTRVERHRDGEIAANAIVISFQVPGTHASGDARDNTR